MVDPSGEKCVCQDGFYNVTMGLLVSYDLLQDFDPAHFAQHEMPKNTNAQCQSCLGELQQCVACVGGVTKLKHGYALSDSTKTAREQTPLSSVIAPAAIFKCPMEGCLGMNESSLSQCDQGYRGPLCSVCSANESYVKEGASCIECSDAASTPMTVVAIIIAALVCVLLVMRRLGSTSNDRSSVVVAHIGFVVQAKILVGLFQITVELPFTLNLIYPKAFMSVLSAVRVSVVDVFAILKVECLRALSVHTKFMLVMALPIVCVVIIYLIRCVSDCRISGKDQDKQRDENRITAAYRTFFVIFLLYPLLSRTVFRTFDCQTLYEDASTEIKEWWHVDDYSVNCNSDSHKTFKALAWIFVVVYPVGIPLVFLLLLWHDNHQRNQSKHVLGSASSFDFLRRDYKDNYYFFEVVVLLEKLLLTGTLTFIQHGTILQTVAGTFIAFVFFGLQVWVCPYRESSDNLLKACAEGQLFVTLLISIVLRTQLEREPVSSDDYGIILVVAFFSTPAMEVLLVLLNMCGCCPAAQMPMPVAEDGVDSRVDGFNLVETVRPTAFIAAHSRAAGLNCVMWIRNCSRSQSQSRTRVCRSHRRTTPSTTRCMIAERPCVQSY
jgi:heme/copper-type cytochrome/quinol oxidase subunit 2